MSPVALRKEDGSFCGSPKSNARSYGSYDHIYQDQNFIKIAQQHVDQSFREFLTKKVQFKEAVTINDPGIVYIIHLSYRL